MPILLFLLALVLTACCDSDDKLTPQQRSRTVLVYQAAQNSLGYSNYHRQDSIEMMAGLKHLHEGETLLLFIDDERPPRLYALERGYKQPRLLQRWDEDFNSAAPHTLTLALNYMRQHFPSDSYGLVLWSHATGWLPSGKSVEQAERNPEPAAPITSPTPKSFGVDVGKNGNMAKDMAALGAHPDEMSIPDLASAIQASGIHPRYILFDCCLMQTIEAAYDLRHATDYIAASPIAIDANGANYTDLLEGGGLFSDDITLLGSSYVKVYQEQFRTPSTSDDYGVVFSILRTDRLDHLAATFRDVVQRTTPHSLASDGYWDMTSTQAYAPYTWRYFYRPEWYDMADALRRHLPEADYALVRQAIDEATVYKATTPTFWAGPSYWDYIAVDADHYSGISMFIPQQRYALNGKASIHGDLNAAFRRTAWYRDTQLEKLGW